MSDHACAQRHGLPVVPVFSPVGTVVNSTPLTEFVGMSRWEARRKVISDLESAKAYVGHRDAQSSVVSICSRSGDIIEPMLMPQWYVRCAELAMVADRLVQSGDIKLIPKRQQATWHSWLTETEDWCVSRQLWWGHRIPMYRIRWAGGLVADSWVAAASEEQAKAKALSRLSAANHALLQSIGGVDETCTVSQDEDVLDTWFSSGLLPILAFGHASGNGHLLNLPGQHSQPPYPAALSTLLETGQDILFFWVARMAMLCTYFAQVPPFAAVLLHPMVRDAQGRKMSKSLGNIIDPMDVIDGAELAKLQATLRSGYQSNNETKKGAKELAKLYPNGFPQFGADALRFTLVMYTQQTHQICMSLDSVKAAYHFCNKLWNTFRFIHMHADRLEVDTDCLDSDGNKQWFAGLDSNELTVFDRALLSRLCGMLRTYHCAMEEYRLALAAETVRDFVQRDLCDRYIEICKLSLFGNRSATHQEPTVAVKILLGSLDIVLRTLHPFMPFLSEELWQRHARSGAGSADMSVMETKWTAPEQIMQASSQAEAESDFVFGVVSSIRSIRQQYAGRIAPAEDGEARFSVAISAPKHCVQVTAAETEAANDGNSSEQRFIYEMAKMHEPCIKLMSKESAIRMICTGEGSGTMVDLGDECGSSSATATAVVSPHVRVVARLVSEEAIRPARETDDHKAALVIAKLEAELEKVRSVVGSAGYQRSAPDAVKQADR
ncbi:hypothetical protein H4R26_003572 [Coemansia thaxteri]|uniref:valine--tRNA ligase n=1 Tax=Coemansia thaxteri TaxID=2663907 RepID=A0A9W8EEH9_9FUNG|nr:hypothetical protein H4R26_003572 [Coemansia thaxteri]